MIAYIIGALIGAAIAIGVYILVQKMVLNGRKNEIIAKAEIEAEGIKNEKIHQAKEKFLQLKADHERYINEKNNQLREAESRIKQKENTLNQQNGELQKKLRDAENAKNSLLAQQEKLSKKAEEYEKLSAQANKQLETIAGMTAQEAKNILMENMKAEARTEAQAYINDTMDEARLNASKEAKRIVINTIQRTAP